MRLKTRPAVPQVTITRTAPWQHLAADPCHGPQRTQESVGTRGNGSKVATAQTCSLLGGGGGGTGNKSESLLSFSLAKRSRGGEALRRESNWELAPAARNRSLMKAMGAACAAVGEASKRNLPTMGGGAQR